MTPEQRKILHDFIVTRNQAHNRLSKEAFLGFFPSNDERAQIVFDLIKEACARQNADDLRSALAIGFTFGLSPKYNHVLCDLIGADWHLSHEDIVWALQGIGLKDEETVEALYKATQTIPAYLEYDEARALAVKAIWALGKIANDAADEKLRLLAESEEPRLREEALNQLHRRQQ